MSDGESIWRDPTFDPNGIDWDHSVVIGDFGLGSDSPIVVDHRRSPTNPRVLRLKWSSNHPFDPRANRWVVFADSFDLWMNMVSWDRGRFASTKPLR